MLEKIKTAITERGAKSTDYWLTKESFNSLVKKAKDIRATEEGYLQLSFETGDVIGIAPERLPLVDEKGGFYYFHIAYFKGLYEEEIKPLGDKHCEIL